MVLLPGRAQARKGNRVRGLPFASFMVDHGVSDAGCPSLFPVFGRFYRPSSPIVPFLLVGQSAESVGTVAGEAGGNGGLSNVWKRSCKMIGRMRSKAATSHLGDRRSDPGVNCILNHREKKKNKHMLDDFLERTICLPWTQLTMRARE